MLAPATPCSRASAALSSPRSPLPTTIMRWDARARYHS
jgi:hypothetical protein